MNLVNQSMSESFFEYFDISYAATQLQRDQVGNIRFRVYCEEFGYEPRSAFPDEIERDTFDAQSLHNLVTHKATNTPAGCVRLVLANDDELLPFEKFCSKSLEGEFFEQNTVPREGISEISRLAVDTQFRRRTGERATRYGGGLEVADISKQEQRTFPVIAVACYLGAMVAGNASGRNCAFAMMEPYLPRLLRRSGISTLKVGKELDYHGIRAPYYMTLEDAINGMNSELREFYEEIQRRMAPSYMQLGRDQ